MEENKGFVSLNCCSKYWIHFTYYPLNQNYPNTIQKF